MKSLWERSACAFPAGELSCSRRSLAETPDPDADKASICRNIAGDVICIASPRVLADSAPPPATGIGVLEGIFGTP